MRPSQHAFISLGLAGCLLYVTKSLTASLVCFLSGVLIDVDHHLDYFLERKKLPWRYEDLKKFCFIPSQGRVYLVFHAYEFLAILWLAYLYFHLDIIWLGLTLGVTVHLFCDQLTNPIKPLFYFLTFRIFHAFEKDKLLTSRYFEGNY